MLQQKCIQKKTINEIVIDASQSSNFSFKELWHYRELFQFLIWRDILVRYKQTVLGVAWVVMRPLLTMVVFSILFGKIAGLSSHGIPYPILVFSALLPWQFFSDSLFFGSGSLVANASMISKIYFPRIFIPTSSVFCCLLDSIVSCSVLCLLMIYYNYPFSWRFPLLFIFLSWCLVFSFSATILVSALTVRYRDFRYIVTFAIQLGMYVSPVGFSTSIIPTHWRLWYSLNPLVGIIDGFRWVILGDSLYLPGLFISGGITLLLLVFGILYFKNVQDSFADII